MKRRHEVNPILVDVAFKVGFFLFLVLLAAASGWLMARFGY